MGSHLLLSMADEKSDEKQEKGDEKSEGKHKEGKWENDPLSGVFVGLILIVFGAIYLGQGYLPEGPWWAWFMVGIGVVFLIDAALHHAKPEWKRPVFGKVVSGVILIAIGLGFIYGLEEWWPFILIAIGTVLLLQHLRKLV
jgi:hypothetical protein